MVVGLLAVVAAARDGAVLGGGVLLEPGGHDGVQLLVLATMSHNLINKNDKNNKIDWKHSPLNFRRFLNINMRSNNNLKRSIVF